MSRLTIPDVADRFRAYNKLHPAWGSLHVVLDDNNIEDVHVEHCREWALNQKDLEGFLLAGILLSMTKTQRRKLGYCTYD